MTHGSVTGWLVELREGSEEAAERLWDRYYGRLLGVARRRLGNLPAHVADEEDIALSAFAAIYRVVHETSPPAVESRDHFWNLLIEIAGHKVLDARRRDQAVKRGGGVIRRLSEANFEREGEIQEVEETRQAFSPEHATIIRDEFEKLLARLGDFDDRWHTLQQIVLLKLEGCTNQEVAQRVDRDGRGLGLRTVERKLKLVRDIWTKGV